METSGDWSKRGWRVEIIWRLELWGWRRSGEWIHRRGNLAASPAALPAPRSRHSAFYNIGLARTDPNCRAVLWLFNVKPQHGRPSKTSEDIKTAVLHCVNLHIFGGKRFFRGAAPETEPNWCLPQPGETGRVWRARIQVP